MSTRTIAKKNAAWALRKLVTAPVVESVPEGRLVDLPDRGRTFVVDVPGPEGAPTVVLIHALGCTSYLSWYPVIQGLSEHYRVVLFDQRWHGRGIRSPRFRFEDCADDLAAVLDALGIDRAIPIGYSMGGAIAQLTWRRHPDRVDGLVLCSTARNFRGKRHEQLFFPLMTAAMLPLSPVLLSRVNRVATKLPELPSIGSADRGWGMVEFRSTSAWSMPAVLDALGRFNSAPWIGDVDAPTSVVITARDRTIPERRQRRLAAAIPGAEVFEVDGGHASLVLKADLFGPALQGAVASVVQRSQSRAARTG